MAYKKKEAHQEMCLQMSCTLVACESDQQTEEADDTNFCQCARHRRRRHADTIDTALPDGVPKLDKRRKHVSVGIPRLPIVDRGAEMVAPRVRPSKVRSKDTEVARGRTLMILAQIWKPHESIEIPYFDVFDAHVTTSYGEHEANGSILI
ncbi:hypothetical protein EDB85DRAFT_1885774 [Lactarius pseudohatsudake]|nr:hypothetical protein EDB85DRAFT_1885774 [Lactarius pseudohatsudake]